jgi:Flp pilus assembly pilin Flp
MQCCPIWGAIVLTTDLRKLLKDDRGITAVEYGLILSMVAGVVICVVHIMDTRISHIFTNIAAAL